MSETDGTQQYRVIADRNKGDNPKYDDAQLGDRLTFTKPRSGLWLTRTLDRIERPTPSTGHPDVARDPLSVNESTPEKKTYTAADVQDAFERGILRGREDANEENYWRRKYEEMNR